MSESASSGGGTALALDLSGIPVELRGLPDAIAARLQSEWNRFVVQPGPRPFVRIDVEHVDEEVERADYQPKAMTSEALADGARFRMREGWADVDPAGTARVHLLRDDDDRRYFTVLNFLRAALGWCLPQRGGALIHAAGLLIDDRVFLLVGPEGSGKSTWARLGEGAGGRVVSDDLVLLDGTGARPEILGAPFRSTHLADYRPGRWPLAGILFPVHGTVAAVESVPPILSRARLTANLPFLVDLEAGARRGGRVVDRLVDQVPCGELTFGLDPSFVGLLRSLA